MKKLIYTTIPPEGLTIDRRSGGYKVYETPKYYYVEYLTLYSGKDEASKIKKSMLPAFPLNPKREINESGCTEAEKWLKVDYELAKKEK
jgi:hypothetical protein